MFTKDRPTRFPLDKQLYEPIKQNNDWNKKFLISVFVIFCLALKFDYFGTEIRILREISYPEPAGNV